MSDANVSRIGQVNLAGDVRALFYKLFTGEVLSAFDRKNVFMSRHRVRNITGGKSAGFANTGRAVGRYHTPGTEITGQNIKANETVITIDDLLIADAFIANIDEAMNNYEVRGEYSHQLGEALARTFDKQGLRAAITAARSANAISGLPGGSTITLSAGYAAAAASAQAVELAGAIYTAHQKFLEKDVEPMGAAVFLKPAEYFLLLNNKDLFNNLYGQNSGNYINADLPHVARLPLIVTNNLPQQDDAANTTAGVTNDGGDVIYSKYAGNYSKTKAVIATPDAAGTVKLIDLKVEDQYDIRRQGTLMVAKMAVGTGVLRPECAQEIAIP
jgi:hypothetical protein